jgi:hypothetical protein
LLLGDTNLLLKNKTEELLGNLDGRNGSKEFSFLGIDDMAVIDWVLVSHTMAPPVSMKA